MIDKPKLVIIVASLVVLALIGGGIFFWLQIRSARGLSIDLVAPEQVLVGVPFDLKINISNNSDNILKEARLSLSLPEGMVFLGSSAQKNIEYRELGNLGPGSLSQELFRLMVISGENSIKRFKASVIYLPASLGASFEKEKALDIAVDGLGLVLDVTTPTKVFGGEDFTAEVFYKNVSQEDYRNLQLIAEYPPTFNFIKSDLPPDVGNREWLLGDLRKGSENRLKITGHLIGPDETFFDLKINIKATFLGESYLISSRTATISISPSPLSLKINLNEDPDFIAYPGDILNYTLNYANDTDISLRDVVIEAQLIGSMFDFSRLNTFAHFRSVDQTLVWNVANTPELALIPAGASGLVSFELRVRPDYPIRRLNDKNFTLRVSAKIESPTVPQFVAATRTLSIAKLETKVAGQTKVDARGYFRDADSGILNQGPFPPRVNKPTNYTIHWRIQNFGTDVSNAEVKAFLGPNVRMTNITKTSTGFASPQYNERTQEIVWQIEKIPATKGVIDPSPEAIFQIEATPSQAGNYWPLIGETTLKATDDFTGGILISKDFPITTSLPDDPTVSSQQGIVIQ